MFWFSDPNPYSTQEPMLGRASLVEPVFMKTVATSCAGMSVYIERMTARSSTSSPNFGKTSLTSIPDLPLRANLNGEAIATPPMPGSSWPSYLASIGFGSKVSTCEGAPWAKMWTTRLALAGKCGDLGASAERGSASWTGAAPRQSSAKRVARPNAPNPIPARWRNWRRVRKKSAGLGACPSTYLRSLFMLLHHTMSEAFGEPAVSPGMSAISYLKCSCQQCGRHIEFPADAIGTSVDCPHCGWPTELTLPAPPEQSAPSPGNLTWPLIGLCVLFVGLRMVKQLALKERSGTSGPLATKSTNTLAKAGSPAVTSPSISTNDFKV